MKLATVRRGETTRAAVIDGSELIELASRDVGELLAAGPDALAAAARADGPRTPLDMAALAPVVPRPSKIICLGHNYRAHIEEMGRAIPSHPTLFAKFGRALIGARDPIVLPAASESMDWEVELAVVIGRPVRMATTDEARAAIGGYTVVNDISARDWQTRTTQWLQGKTFESTTPVGPWLVTPDEVDHARDLAVSCQVDGEVVQSARTSDMIFDPATTVAYVSQILTLDPGDIIATGTPAGVGAGRSPARYLSDGAEVTTTVEGIGTLVNVCRAAGSWHPSPPICIPSP